MRNVIHEGHCLIPLYRCFNHLGNIPGMEFGWLDVCLKVADVTITRGFYERLGFVRFEGDDEKGWAVMVLGEARIGLYSKDHMENDAICLNFRGGNIRLIAVDLQDKHFVTEAEPRYVGFKGGSIKLRDPDGHLIFFDSSDDETKS